MERAIECIMKSAVDIYMVSVAVCCRMVVDLKLGYFWKLGRGWQVDFESMSGFLC